MKLLHVLDTVDPRSGGPIEAVVREADILSGYGVEPEIATLDAPDLAALGDLRLPVHAFGYRRHGLGGLLGGTFRYAPEFAQWLRAHARDYDVVIAHGVWSFHTVAVAAALAGSGTPYLIYAHGMLDPWFRRTYPLKHLKKQLYWSLALGRAMCGAESVLFTAEDELLGAAGGFIGHQQYRGRVVAMGTADAPPPDAGQVEAFRAAVPLSEGRRHLLFLGRIHPKKGCDLLVEAFARVAATQLDLDLVMAGPDPAGWRATLEPLAARLGVGDRIHWPGMLSGDAKWGAFRTAEAFALPSHQENFGIAVAEALACGLPVLITPRINIWREIDSAGAGLIGDDDLAGTIDALTRFLALTAEERGAMGARARALFESRFDVRRTAPELLEVLRTAARGAPAPAADHVLATG